MLQETNLKKYTSKHQKSICFYNLVDMFPYTSDFLKTAENPLICSRKRKVQKIRPRHQSKRLVPRRNLGLDVKDREIGVFKTLINKGFPDIRFFSRLLCRKR
jgi:hypothetical protein